jgi:hypothetical protein
MHFLVDLNLSALQLNACVRAKRIQLENSVVGPSDACGVMSVGVHDYSQDGSVAVIRFKRCQAALVADMF